MNNEKRCKGCGVLLQDENILQEGYTTNLENDLCQRCFRMKNYGEYQVITKSNDEYIEILKEVIVIDDELECHTESVDNNTYRINKNNY